MHKVKCLVVIFYCMVLVTLSACGSDTTIVKKPGTTADEGGLALPGSFSSIKVTSGLGRARHIVVAANGDLFVKLEKLKDGKGIYRLHDGNGDGKADEVTGFGNYTGTGIAIKNGYLYASSNTEVYRYKINEKTGKADEASVQKIVTGLWDKHQHESKSLALDNAGNIYVNIGAPSK